MVDHDHARQSAPAGLLQQFGETGDLLDAVLASCAVPGVYEPVTIGDRSFEAEKATRSFIRTYIFPGGCLPSNEIIARNLAEGRAPTPPITPTDRAQP